MNEFKEFSVSSNGDRWSLETNDGDTVVVHTANQPSGGHQTRTALAAFLEERAGKPEHAALLQVLGQPQSEVEHQLREEETFISDNRKDQGSDAARGDPDTADRDRESLGKEPQRGIDRAMRGDLPDETEVRSALGPAVGGIAERNLARGEAGENRKAGYGASHEPSGPSMPGSQAAEPSPEGK